MSAARVAEVGLVVFTANAALLVLQLVAGRLLAPFVGVSLATWTAVIGVFLAGISLGNWLGGRLADRGAGGRTLSRLLFGGAATMLVTLGVVLALGDGTVLRPIPLYPRILLLLAVTALPPALVLSLITPVAIKLQLPDVAHTGRVAGLVYALGTLGSLVGTFLTGFVLIAHLTTYVIVLATAAVLAGLGVAVRTKNLTPPAPLPEAGRGEKTLESSPPFPLREGGPGGLGSSSAALPLPAACAVVFAASFCSMALEIAASRLLAPHLGVSLYSWTGIIGVVLAGVMVGNWLGGRIADRSPKAETLGTCLFLGGLFTLLVLILVALLSHRWDTSIDRTFTKPLAEAINWVNGLGLVGKIVAWAAVLFALPMLLLGTISPQVTRLAVADWGHAGRVAGRVYAWSCAGAIAGTFAAGWGGIPLLGGVNGLILAVALVLVVLAAAVGGLWRRPGELFLGVIVVSAALTGLVIRGKLTSQYDLETNYYAIRTYDEEVYDEARGEWEWDVDKEGRRTRKLALDLLTHSYVKGWVKEDEAGHETFTADPTFMGYPHEQVQAEFTRLAAERTGGKPNVLVIGGGGYTYPRWVNHTLPAASVEVVEIDPGVTEVAQRKLGLPRDTPIKTHHLDGRQFVQERAPKGHYQLVVQDAVNDLSVPYHILTKEYNDAVKSLLMPDGVYLLTVIDEFEEGLLMRAAVRTMRETFPHVHLLGAGEIWRPRHAESGDERPVSRQVWVISGSAEPLDLPALTAAVAKQGAGEAKTAVMPDAELQAYLDGKPATVLTDAFAPADNLLSVMFRLRGEDDRRRRE